MMNGRTAPTYWWKRCPAPAGCRLRCRCASGYARTARGAIARPSFRRPYASTQTQDRKRGDDPGRRQTRRCLANDGLACDQRPDVELREDEGRRRERVERDASVAGRVERQVVVKVDVEAAREGRCARRVVRVGELRVCTSLPHEVEHRARLQAFTHRRRVHPEQRARTIAYRLAPLAIPRADATSRAEGLQQLRFTVRRDDCRASGELPEGTVPQLNGKAHALRVWFSTPLRSRRRRSRRRPAPNRRG